MQFKKLHLRDKEIHIYDQVAVETEIGYVVQFETNSDRSQTYSKIINSFNQPGYMKNDYKIFLDTIKVEVKINGK